MSDNEHNNGGVERSYGDDSLLSALERQWGAAPWYIGSFGIHMLLFAILLLFTPPPTARKKPPVKVAAEIVEPDIEEDIEIQEEIELLETEDETEVTDTEVEIEIEVTPDETLVVDAEEDALVTDDTDFDDSDDGVIGVPSNLGSGGRGRSGISSRVSSAGKKKKNQQAGMTKASARALARGLRWLAKVQERDGHWDTRRYEGHHTGPAVTALAQLAFLGAGNSTIIGRYRKNVRESERWLKKKYIKNNPAKIGKGGLIGDFKYEAAVTMMAMAESWAMNEDKKLKPFVQSLVDTAINGQCMTGRYKGSWGYKSCYGGKEGQQDGIHADTSVAGWWMMGLKSAKVAGVKIPDRSWDAAREYFRAASQKSKDGNVYRGVYAFGVEEHAATMTAVNLTCLQFLGIKGNDPMLKGLANWFVKTPEGKKSMPSSKPKKLYYYLWYYQALGFFQMGTNSKYWTSFAPTFQSMVNGLQKTNGSWPIEIHGGKVKAGEYGEKIGIVGTTATACLMLEIAYRYDSVRDN